ncbi:MAG: TrkH family potassium uptake protein [Clostridiales bacterium]|jgi:trk system potassium uptake protein TrkH|nr:TrkH family potassium uptake protein [Clostridiales bacterium]
MNGRLIINILARLLLLEAVLLLPSLGVALYYGEGDAMAFVYTLLLVLAVSLPLMLLKPKNKDVRAKEGLVAVSLAWVLLSAFGALPFMIHGGIPRFIDAMFETVSGFTTTGASIVRVVEDLPRGLLFWRSFTHWVGGMGVLILTLAIMPNLSGRGSVLARAESPGPTFSKAAPKMRDTARLMYAIYTVMTLIQLALMLVSGLPLYDALIHTLGTAGTGGFSNRNLSMGAYNNPWAEMITMAFMLLFGMNFVVYIRLLRGEGLKSFQSDEVKAYWLLAAASMLFIALEILPEYGNFLTALRYSSFQVSSIMSTTGYATTDFALWPAFSHILLLLLMLVGACAGSTAGGIKVSRVVILGKAANREIGQAAAPRKVRLLMMDKKQINEETLRSVLIFFFLYMAFLLLGTLVASTDGHDFVTSFSAAASCLSNIGPGLGLVGPVGNFDVFSPHVKVILTFLMLAGRLEFIPLLTLFHRELWNKSH